MVRTYRGGCDEGKLVHIWTEGRRRLARLFFSDASGCKLWCESADCRARHAGRSAFYATRLASISINVGRRHDVLEACSRLLLQRNNGGVVRGASLTRTTAIEPPEMYFVVEATCLWVQVCVGPGGGLGGGGRRSPAPLACCWLTSSASWANLACVGRRPFFVFTPAGGGGQKPRGLRAGRRTRMITPATILVLL